MPDKQSFSNYIDPTFARYDPILAKAMTEWLYRDPKSNPSWNQPELWPAGPRVQIVKRALDFDGMDAGDSETQKLSLVGGKNALVFSRMATVTLDTEAISTIPSTLSGYVDVEQRRTDGFLEIETMPINNAFGVVPGWPETCPAPQFWVGNSDRVLVVTNNWTAALSVRLAWMVAFLDSAR